LWIVVRSRQADYNRPWRLGVLQSTGLSRMKITTIPHLYRNVNRWGEILTVLSKYGLADWLSQFDLNFAKGWFKDRDGHLLARQSRETRIRLALVELGPTFIKLGQILSTRPDIVGVPFAHELARLQSDVEATSAKTVHETIESELRQPIDELFDDFEDQPLASASIGQVHRARLKNGQLVVVKVQHAQIERKVRVDLDILAGLAQLAAKIPEFVNYRPRATVAEFQRILVRELNFGREERNMLQFIHDFKDNPTIKIPQPYGDFCTARVLTMELIEGTKLSDREAIVAAGLDMDELARRGAELYLEMIFTHGFYHADPHPGNMLLLEGNVFGLLDFGMVGRLEESLREDIENMLLAIVNSDDAALTAAITRLGDVPGNLDEGMLRMDISEFVSHYGNQPLNQLDLSGLLNEMMEIIRRYHIMLPAQIGMLLKTLVMLEGTAREISPEFSLIEVMEPFQKEVLQRRLSPKRRLRKIRKVMMEVEQLIETLPGRMNKILAQIQSGRFDVHLKHRGLEPSVNRLVLGMLASALFLGSALLLSQNILLLRIFGGLGSAISLLLGLRLLRAINKSGNLERSDDFEQD
jgi:ubiquinone biosynthesis protein